MLETLPSETILIYTVFHLLTYIVVTHISIPSHIAVRVFAYVVVSLDRSETASVFRSETFRIRTSIKPQEATITLED